MSTLLPHTRHLLPKLSAMIEPDKNPPAARKPQAQTRPLVTPNSLIKVWTERNSYTAQVNMILDWDWSYTLFVYETSSHLGAAVIYAGDPVASVIPDSRCDVLECFNCSQRYALVNNHLLVKHCPFCGADAVPF